MALRDDPDLMRKYKREWVAKRKAEWFSDKYCVVCGSTETLELDHIDRSTKVSHSIWSWSEIRRNEELAKCQVLCHDHHLEKTVLENKQVQGSMIASSKLNEEIVRTLRGEYESGISGITLAKKYGVNKSNIYRVLRGEAWQGV